MDTAKIQLFRQIGKHLRRARDMRGFSLVKISGVCGLSVQELARIENGELMAFKQSPETTKTNAQIYSKVLGVDLDRLVIRDAALGAVHATNDAVYIPVFLRKR